MTVTVDDERVFAIPSDASIEVVPEAKLDGGSDARMLELERPGAPVFTEAPAVDIDD
jgi:hypothetical protein